MVHDSLFSLLTANFSACKIDGTSISEDGIKISIEKSLDEFLYFYRIDCQNGRSGLNIAQDNQPICDYLIFYTKNRQASYPNLLCFLELKGCNFEHAVKQIVNTLTHLTILLRHSLSASQHPYTVKSTAICTHSSAPSPKIQRVNNELLKRHFGDKVHIKHGIKKPYRDLGKFLRPIYDQHATELANNEPPT